MNIMRIIEQLADLKHQEDNRQEKQERREECIQQSLEKAVRLLMIYTDLSPSELAEAVGVSVDLVDKIRMKLNTE
jgi:helix-turn-helix protein